MSDYGLEVKNANGRLLFDSRKTGRGTFQFQKGTVAMGDTLSCKVSDMLLFNIDRPPAGTNVTAAIVTGTKTQNGTDLEWVFQGGYNNVPVNYVILRDAATDTRTRGVSHGLQCNDLNANGYTGPVSFDSRMFNSSEGEIEIDPSEIYFNPFGHGQPVSSRTAVNGVIKTGWNGWEGTDYYNAGVCEFSSVSYYIRKFGLLFSTTNTNGSYQQLYAANYGQYGNPPYTTIQGSQITVSAMAYAGAVYAFSETASSGMGFQNHTYGDMFQAMYIGKPNTDLGLYQPEEVFPVGHPLNP